MPSPFPGMDPFLEAHWDDVHAPFIVYASDQLQRQLPAGLVAGGEQYVSLEIDERPTRFRPDVAVMGSGSGEQSTATATATAMLEADEPYLADEPEVHRGIRIEDAHDPVPPLSPSDDAWMIEVLASHGITRPRGAA